MKKAFVFSGEDREGNVEGCNSYATWRTHTCGEVGEAEEGRRVVLCGWLHTRRLNFLLLRDAYGTTQVVLPPGAPTEHLPLESVLQVEGSVRRRPPGQQNQVSLPSPPRK
jgi:aspartyl-tRNA synthetase